MNPRADDMRDEADPLGAFSSELGDEAAGPQTASLEDIISRGTPVQWDEAVAVVEDLCEALNATGRSDPQVPPLQSILVGADGTVALKQGPRGERGVIGVARTLHALLSTASVPVALRLFITQAMAPDSYPSLRDFAIALAYFGKPLRVDLIRALYERYAAGIVSPKVPHVAVPPPPPLPQETPRPRRQKSMLLRSIVVAAAVMTLAVAVLWIWSKTRMSGVVSSSPSVSREAGKETTKESSIPVPKRSASPSAAAQTSTDARRKPTAAAAGTRGAVNERPLLPLESFQVLPPRLEPATSTGAINPPPSPEYVSSPKETNRQPAAASTEEVVPVIYSRADTNVRPPVLLYPQLPPPMPVDVRSDAVNSMELVVSETGQVEQVRIVAGPRRMPDMMLLSGAKMWRFKPALKDGQPVRYRTIVSWSGLP